MDPNHITGLVLAGGRGSRMGGVDKGLQPHQGLPLVAHALSRLAPQVGRLMVNANRNLSAYAALGVPVWPDPCDDFPGPMAGFRVGLEHCETPYLMTVPCDSPRFPLDVVARLAVALVAESAEVAMVVTLEPSGEQQRHMQRHPVFCLMQREVLDSLVRFMATGQRRLDRWALQQRCAQVVFDAPGDAQAFVNVNTVDELHQLA